MTNKQPSDCTIAGSLESTQQVRHLAIVMDGNQRWARGQGQSGPMGHREGAKAVKRIVTAAGERHIQYLSLFAFSSENWRRPAAEVDLLMQLFSESIDQQLTDLQANRVRLHFIGDLTKFGNRLQIKMHEAMAATASNTGLNLVIAVNYGGQWDIVQAAKQLVARAQEGKLKADELSLETFEHALAIPELPPVDLFIRTSGEQRISNFFLWQLAYAELYFTPVHWPEFTAQELDRALAEYQARNRRFGQSSEALLSSGQSSAPSNASGTPESGDPM